MKNRRLKAIEDRLQEKQVSNKIKEIKIEFISTDGSVESTMTIPIGEKKNEK